MNEYTEEEQINHAKLWLKENGRGILSIIVVVLLSYSGWNIYSNYTQNKVDEASETYFEFVGLIDTIVAKSKISSDKIDQAHQVVKDMQERYSSSLYPVLASLHMAKVEVERENYTTAETLLQWAVDNVPDKGLKNVVNLRLSRVKNALGNVSSSLDLLDEGSPEFTSLNEELKGDFLLKNSKISEAIIAYKKALDGLKSEDRNPVLQLKLSEAMAILEQNQQQGSQK